MKHNTFNIIMHKNIIFLVSVLHEMRYGNDAVGKLIQFYLLTLPSPQGLRFETLSEIQKYECFFFCEHDILKILQFGVYVFSSV